MAFTASTLLGARPRTASCHSCTRTPGRLKMSVHHLRPATLAWVLPAAPSWEQLRSEGGVDAALAGAAMAVAGLGALSILPPMYALGRALAANGRTRCAPHGALLLGTVEDGHLYEGAREPLPIAAPPALHGAPTAALVLAYDPACERVVRVVQAYVPSHDKFLVLPGVSRVRSDRLLQLIKEAQAT